MLNMIGGCGFHLSGSGWGQVTGCFGHGTELVAFHKMWEVSWLAEVLVAFEEGMCFMELIVIGSPCLWIRYKEKFSSKCRWTEHMEFAWHCSTLSVSFVDPHHIQMKQSQVISKMLKL
jgi:hypothetical protein